ncbi:hypothetical protein B0H10DRAFT_2213171 [Mycena sp. CBHHK59/15]|nr:hypothetical protein B0H10DRAFT_2213171 [Mycena sp. CBHHK59/15]
MDKEQYYLLLGLADDFLDLSKGLGTAELSEGLQEVFGAKTMAPNLSEATLFDNPDPYGHTALEEDKDNSDTQEGTVIVRSFDAHRLAIEVLVNLEAPALVGRLTPENATKPTAGTSTARSTPAAPQKAKWTASSASWGKNDGGW